MNDPYEEGYSDGFDGYGHDNPYVEMSPDWVEYEQGSEDGIMMRDDD
jgi:hypothetical protein